MVRNRSASRKAATSGRARFRATGLAAGALLSAIAAFATPPTSAAAEEMVPAKEQFEYWSTFLIDEGGAKLCYTASPNVDAVASRDGISRDQAYLSVSVDPTRGNEQVISVYFGYTPDSDKEMTLKIGAAEFRLFNDGENAWFERASQHNAAVTAMKRGAKAFVTATSTRGTTITDEYSLIGFTKALETVEGYCK